VTVMAVDGAAGKDWTGFVLLIVPVAGLAVDADALFRDVQDQVDRDVVLQDTVRVGISADIALGRGAGPVVEALSSTVLNSGGAMFAPSAVFGCAVVGNDVAEANRVAEDLADAPILRRLNVFFYGVAAQPDESGSGFTDDSSMEDTISLRPIRGPGSKPRPDAVTVASVVSMAVALMEKHERNSGYAISGRQFAQMTARPPAPVAAPREVSASTRAMPTPPPPTTYSDPADDPYARRPRLFERISAVTSRPGPPTQAEALDRLARVTDAVQLVYIVMPMDAGKMGRAVHRRRAELVVELDRALALATADHAAPGAGAEAAPSRISAQTVLLSAGRRMTRSGPMTPVGKLSVDAVPKLSAGHFDLVTCIDDFVGIQERDAASLARRGVDLIGVNVVFVSTGAPLADAVSVARLEQLTHVMDVSWILLGDAWELMSEDFAAIGVRSFEGHADVANELVATAFTIV